MYNKQSINKIYVIDKSKILPTTERKQVYLWHSLCTNKFVKYHAHKHMQKKITMLCRIINGPTNYSFSFGYVGLLHKKHVLAEN